MDDLVFISYSSKDVDLANKIVEYLEGHGYPCWIAPRNITSGHDYTDMINDAIQNCRAVVLLVSGRALRSQWVKKEISTAVSYDKPILPYRVANVEITGGFQFLLNNVQWIDATGNPSGHLPDLVDGLEQRLPTTSAPGRKRTKAPLIVGLSAAVVALAGGGFLIWKGDKPATELTPPADSIAVVTQPLDTTVTSSQPIIAVQPIENIKAKPKAVTTQTPRVKDEKPEEAKVAVEEVPATVTPDTTGQAVARRAAEEATKAKAAELAFQNKKKEALKCYNTQRYRDALNLFEELRRERPSDKEIIAYINDCHRVLGTSGR